MFGCGERREEGGRSGGGHGGGGGGGGGYVVVGWAVWWWDGCVVFLRLVRLRRGEESGRLEIGMQGWWDSVQWLMEEANLWIGIGSLVWIVCVCVLGRGKDEV